MATKVTRPSLAGLPLTPKMSTQQAEAPLEGIELDVVDEDAAEPASEPRPPARRGPKRKTQDAKVVLMLRVDAPDRKKIRQIALAQDTTVQALLEESVKDIIRRHRGRQIS